MTEAAVHLPERPQPISLTPAAVDAALRARAEENLADHGLRIGVIGGGCSGLQYLLDFSPAPTTGDWVTEANGLPVYIDQFSAVHLEGTVIDFVDGLHGSGFKFENPNIKRACGCGSSFQT